MDLIAYSNGHIDEFKNYLDKYYGDIPRYRGARLMKLEDPIPEDSKPNPDVNDWLGQECTDDYSEVNDMFNKYVGQDVIYIHTRCGSCGDYDDPDNNYISCGARDWEEAHKDLFLDHVTDAFDQTYCTHYFKAVINDEYQAIIDKALHDLSTDEEGV